MSPYMTPTDWYASNNTCDRLNDYSKHSHD